MTYDLECVGGVWAISPHLCSNGINGVERVRPLVGRWEKIYISFLLLFNTYGFAEQVSANLW